MTKSSKNVAQEAVEKLSAWLATSPVIPIHNNQVNKAEICRRLGITRSTVGSNPQLRSLFASISAAGVERKVTTSKSIAVSEMGLVIHDLHTELVSARNTITELRRQILMEEYLLVKGQMLDE